MSSHVRFDDDDVDFSEPSESDEEYTEKERQLLNKVRNRKKEYSDSEDEVFGVGPNEDDDDDDEEEEDEEDDDDQSDLALSDVEGQDEDDDLPDIRAWGQDKRKYYSTDYVDPDYGGFQGKDAHLAELEEQEATKLQKQLAEQLDDADFDLDMFAKKTEEDNKQVEELIKTDISKLSTRQKMKLLEKDSPEFFGLVEDFEVKMSIAKDYLDPVLQLYKKNKIPDCKAVEFVKTQYTLILNYSTNIYMYLLLKLSKVNVANHPIIKRLFQYRQLLSELDPTFTEVIKPQIELLLADYNSNNDVKEDKKEKKKKLKLLTSLMNKPDQPKKKKKQVTIAEPEQPSKKMKVDQIVSSSDGKESTNKMDEDLDDVEMNSSSEEENQEDEQEEEIKESEAKEVDKRAITYEMAKNKGLTPHRKKENRNPRVKHRLKYRKAIIRRKGAVREPRKELTRYSGEISGIKASVSKSIKIKT